MPPGTLVAVHCAADSLDMTHKDSIPTGNRLVRFLLVMLLLWGTLWFIWFDSFSLIRRIRWQQEHALLQQENALLKEKIVLLESQLASPPSDETIEQIAREQYGMRREGETVYRVEE